MFLAPLLGYVLIALVMVVLLTVSPPRNRVVGVRTRATMRSDAAWAAGQRATRGYLVAMAAVALVAAGALLVARHATGWATAITLGGWFLILGLVAAAGRAAGRAARAADPEDPANPAH